MNKMKRLIAILTLSMLIGGKVHGQIYLGADDANNRTSSGATDPLIPVAGGLEYDQSNYVPLGESILLLAALGGAYLINKRKKIK